MSQLWPVVHRRLRRALLARAAKHMTHGVSVQQVTVETGPDRAHATVDFVYDLGAPPAAGGVVAFEIPQGMPSVRTVECAVASERDPWHGEGRIASDLLLLTSASGQAWDGAQVRFRLEWSRRDDERTTPGNMILIPDLAPRLVQSSLHPSRGIQPRVRWSRPGDENGWFAAVAEAATTPTSSDEVALLQLAIGRGDESSPRGTSSPVTLTRAFRARLQAHEEKGVTEQIVNMLSFLGRSFGVSPALRVGVALPSELRGVRWVPPGACFLGKPDEFGYAATPREIANINLSSRLASIWWGAGCRVVGRGGEDVATGINRAVGLHWATVLGDTNILPRVLDDYRRLAHTTALQDAWAAFTESGSAKLVTCIALSLYDAITHGQIGDTLQTLTRKNWGRFVDAGELISSLSLPGKYGDMARRMVIGN